MRREARTAPVLKGDRPHENPSNPFKKISLCHRSAWMVRRTWYHRTRRCPEHQRRGAPTDSSFASGKAGTNPIQRKLSTSLVYATARSRGVIPGNIDTLGNPNTSLQVDSRYGVLVDIKATPSTELLNTIRQAGGQVIYASASGSIRARIPLSRIEPFAARADIRSIKAGSSAKSRSGAVQYLARRARSPLPGLRLLDNSPLNLFRSLGLAYFIGLTTTQGYVTHDKIGATQRANGTGVRVGVLSDSAEYIPALIASRDLPPDAQNVADIIDGPGSSEGSAMMEIVYDMAPGVRLFFASAFNSPDSFADNIRLLRNTYNCDVIVDDVGWSDEAVFQDNVIAQAVNDVTQSGGLYFSSAGNSGNLTNGNSSTWEGDFTPGGALARILFTRSGRVLSTAWLLAQSS